MRKVNIANNNAFRMVMQLPRYCSASHMFAMCNVYSCQVVIRNLVHIFTIVWIAVGTNYYVPLAAVKSDITHELGSTGCCHCMCIFVHEYYCYVFSLSSILFWTSVLCIENV